MTDTQPTVREELRFSQEEFDALGQLAKSAGHPSLSETCRQAYSHYQWIVGAAKAGKDVLLYDPVTNEAELLNFVESPDPSGAVAHIVPLILSPAVQTTLTGLIADGRHADLQAMTKMALCYYRWLLTVWDDDKEILLRDPSAGTFEKVHRNPQ